MSGGSPRLPGSAAAAIPLDAAGQQIADDIWRWMSQDLPQAAWLRACAEQAVADLRQSVSLESLPEMAMRLTLVRLADIPVAATVECEPQAGPHLSLVPDTGIDLPGADV